MSYWARHEDRARPWNCPWCGKRRLLHWNWTRRERPTPRLLPIPREWFGCRWAFTRQTETRARYGKGPPEMAA